MHFRRTTCCSLLVPFFVVGVATSTYADNQTREITELVLGVNGSLKSLSYDAFTGKAALRLVSPHPTKNPKKETATWSGEYVTDLFKTVGLTLPAKPGDTPVTFIASDDYNVEIPLSDVLKPGVVIATKRDGRKIPWFDGGPQMVHPLGDKALKRDYERDSWWAWYVKAVIVGSPSANLTVVRKTKLEQVALSGVKGAVEEARMALSPAGHRTTERVPREAVKQTSLDLKAFLASRYKIGPEKVVVHTINGKSFDLDLTRGGYQVIYKWNDETIPVTLGGPVQICGTAPRPEIMNCIYYVRELAIP